MKLRLFTDPQQGASYGTVLTVAKAAEAHGFDGFFRSDHYLTMGGDGLPGPTDTWATLAALARETSGIRLGALVTAATFRLPGPLAITVAQVDEMSGGRVEMGLGTGWYEAEHTAYGIPFPSQSERFERLEEQLEIITGLWATPVGGSFSHTGRYYRLTGSPALPKPVQRPHPPIIIGGHGTRWTPRLAATFADEYNAYQPLADAAAQYGRVRQACEAVGRDPASIVLSATQTACVGADETEIARRARAIGRDPARIRDERLVVAGTPGEVTAKLRAFAEAGASHVYLQVLDLSDLDHLALIAEEVKPHLG